MRAAGARDAVLEYIKKDFSCDACAARTQPRPHRRAALPRTFMFKIVALDVFYLPYSDRSVPFLSAI
eukprot:7279896-Alexandrium_andersonii.AAC.1